MFKVKIGFSLLCALAFSAVGLLGTTIHRMVHPNLDLPGCGFIYGIGVVGWAIAAEFVVYAIVVVLRGIGHKT